MTKSQLPIIICIAIAIFVSLFSHILYLRQDYFMDEAIILGDALTFLSEKTIIPRTGFYPTFFAYMSTPFVAIYVVVSSFYSGLSSEVTTAYLLSSNEWLLVILPRILSLIFFTLTAITFAIFLVNRFGKFPGIMTGLFILSSPAFLRHGSLALPDIGVLLFSSVSFIFCLKAGENGHNFRHFTRYVMLSAMFCGFATATKYNAAATVFPLAVLLIVRVLDRENADNRFLFLPFLAAFVFFVAFVVATPSWIVATQTMVNGITFQLKLAESLKTGATGIPILGQLGLMIKNSPVLFVFAALSIFTPRKFPKYHYLICITSIIGMLFLSTRTSVQQFHYLFPLYPAVFLSSACSLAWLSEKFGSPARIFAYVICFAITAYTFHKSSSHLRGGNVDMARVWIYNNFAEDTKIALDWAYVPRLFSEEQLQNYPYIAKYPTVEKMLRKNHKLYDLEQIYRQENWIKTTDADYLVVSSGAYKRYFSSGWLINTVPPETSKAGMTHRRNKKFYETLFTNRTFSLAVEFSSGSGPTIKIFKRVE